MKKSMIISIFILSFILILSSCNKDEEREYKFPNLRIEGFSSMQKSGNNSIEALYFGELEIVAYNYRPGEEIQNNAGFGNDNGDWSYFVLLPGGFESSRDNALFSSGVINISDYLEYQYEEQPTFYFEEEYLESGIPFEVDVLEIVMHRTGVVRDGKYYGNNGAFNGHDMHPMHKYPEYSEIPNYFAYTVWPGLESNSSQDINVMFVNDTYISTPLQILTHEIDGQLVFTQTNRDVSLQEEEFIKSLINQGTMRRFYTYLNIIPYSGPVVWDFSNNIAPDITVKVNMDYIIDINQTNFEEIETMEQGYWGNIYYLGGENDIPFGFNIQF